MSNATSTKPRATKEKESDKRVAFEVPREIEDDYVTIATQLGTTRAGLASLATKFAVLMVKQGKLVRLNNDLVDPTSLHQIATKAA